MDSNRTLGAEAVEAYRRDGFVLAPALLDADVLSDLVELAPRMLAEESPRRILERDGSTVRSVYGPHQHNERIAAVCRMPQMAGAARELVGGPVYIHQSKINVKAAFVGDQWEWHQDYVYWLQDDGVQRPDLVNVAVFLDEVTEFNGPLTFIPGSQDKGVLAGTMADGMPLGYDEAPQWVSTLTADEKYAVDREVISSLARTNGLASPKGPAGSVLLFHPNILHASSPNISPFGRTTLIVVYNSVTNPPVGAASPRPVFLAARDITPLPE
jgi:ectoine hydroxylase